MSLIKLLYDLLLYVCVIVMVHLFAVRRRKRKHQQKADGGSGGRWQTNLLAVRNGDSE